MPTLYTDLDSGNAYKILLLAALLGEKLDTVEIDLAKGEQDTPEFLAINPKGEVPALVDGSNVVTDSSGILVYVAGKHKENKYWSMDPFEQASIVSWLAFANSWVQYGVFTARAVRSFNAAFNGLGRRVMSSTLEEATIRGHRSLEILNCQLGKTEWLTLGRPTIADIAVFPYIALAPMGDISLDPYPNVVKWIERIKRLPGFISMIGLDDPMFYRK